MKQPVEVEVLGQRLTVASDEGETHARDVAEYVNAKARQLAGDYPRANVIQIALLTALNIASEYWKLNLDRADADEVIERLSQQLDAASNAEAE